MEAGEFVTSTPLFWFNRSAKKSPPSPIREQREDRGVRSYRLPSRDQRHNFLRSLLRPLGAAHLDMLWKQLAEIRSKYEVVV
jgi:hypothetical protein